MKSRMKIFATVTAVALVLGAFTLASCSNSSSSDDSSSGGNGSSGNNSSSGNGNSSGDNNASSLEGLWIIDESIDDEEEGETGGYYFKGDTLYPAVCMDGKYYYFEDEKESISVSGDKIVSADGDELTFKITGNTPTLSMGDVSFTLNKVNSTPEKMSMSDFGPDLN